MRIDRKSFLYWVLGLLAVAAIVHFFWPDGLITLDFKEAPIGKVIASIERQGHVRILTNLPPETPVTMQMRAPLMEVLETLSVRVESDLRAVFVGAPGKSQSAEAFESLKSGKGPESFEVAWFPSMGMSFGTADPRTLTVRFEPAETNSLQSALQQLAQKSGVMTAVAREWNPAIVPATKPTTAATAIRQVIHSSGGYLAEGFLLWNRGDRSGDGRGPDGEGGGPGGGGWPRGGRDAANPEWVAQRTVAMIAQLPPEEQPAAKAEFDAMRKVWDEVRALPEDQRREKMAEVFSRPEVQDRMADRMAARDARRTPAQREQRMKSYLERKAQMKAKNP